MVGKMIEKFLAGLQKHSDFHLNICVLVGLNILSRIQFSLDNNFCKFTKKWKLHHHEKTGYKVHQNTFRNVVWLYGEWYFKAIADKLINSTSVLSLDLVTVMHSCHTNSKISCWGGEKLMKLERIKCPNNFYPIWVTAVEPHSTFNLSFCGPTVPWQEDNLCITVKLCWSQLLCSLTICQIIPYQHSHYQIFCYTVFLNMNSRA